MRRYTNFDTLLSRKLLKHPTFRRSYLLSAVENHHIPMEEALKETIQCMGLKEFSELSGISHQNICDYLTGNRHPKIETLDKYLKPFGLQIYLGLKKRRAA